jgi:DNA-binding Lrp family transcriptional regulator
MNVPAQFDPFELSILRALQRDGRLSVSELAERVGLSASPTWRRVRALETRGVIRRYVALLDAQAAGVPQCVFVQVTLVKQDLAAISAFEAAVMDRPEVLECFAMTGDADYLLRVMVPDAAAFERFLQDAVFTRPVVQHVRSNFALRQVKYETAIPVG